MWGDRSGIKCWNINFGRRFAIYDGIQRQKLTQHNRAHLCAIPQTFIRSSLRWWVCTPFWDFVARYLHATTTNTCPSAHFIRRHSVVVYVGNLQPITFLRINKLQNKIRTWLGGVCVCVCMAGAQCVPFAEYYFEIYQPLLACALKTFRIHLWIWRLRKRRNFCKKRAQTPKMNNAADKIVWAIFHFRNKVSKRASERTRPRGYVLCVYTQDESPIKFIGVGTNGG